jgi:hypothetical protein
MELQKYLGENRDSLFKKVANLVSADYYEDPPRIVLTVTKLLKKLPKETYEGEPVPFEQMIIGGVIMQNDRAQSPLDLNHKGVMPIVIDPEQIFGAECIGPENTKANDPTALEAWKARHKNIKRAD